MHHKHTVIIGIKPDVCVHVYTRIHTLLFICHGKHSHDFQSCRSLKSGMYIQYMYLYHLLSVHECMHGLARDA